MSRSFLTEITASVSLLLSLTSCGASTTTPTTVTVDPRIELMGIVQYLDGYMLSTKYEFNYKTEVEEYFGEFREHEAVTIFHHMAAGGFTFDAVPKTMLTLTDPPDLESNYDFPADVVALAGGEESLETFVAAMRDFAIQTDFISFFNGHRSLYDSLTTEATPTMVAAVDALEEYLGDTLSGAHVILGVLLHHGGFSTLFETHRSREAFVVIGPAGGNGTYPGFGAARRLGSIAWHEFAHTVVNDLTAKNRDWLDANLHRYETVAEDLGRYGYGTWETVVNEHIVRAINARMLLRHLGPAVGRSAVITDESRGFVYLASLVNALSRYETSRDKYAGLRDFYPELLEAFVEETPADTTVMDGEG